jgi:cyclic lactone autoinducer peptide
MKNLTSLLKKAAEALIVFMVVLAAGGASSCHFYQPKEPANLKQRLEK